MNASSPQHDRRRLLIAAVVAVAVFAGAAVSVWQLDSSSSGASTTSTESAVPMPAIVAVKPEIVSAVTLRQMARALGQPVYWAGSRAGTRIEFTRASSGSTYVRYLTGSAKAGDKRPNFVVVATYAQPDAYARVEAIAKKQNLDMVDLPNGAVAVTEPGSPRNIHVVFKTLPYQVEVYAPSAAEARSIVQSGALKPAG
ncbi:MAG TPA: hypothetical protein VEH52_00875 [Gaiellaceae bacterium]|nr:hypothetical protein [Gaiellaceae bacterium]